VPVISDRLYWSTVDTPPQGTQFHWFSVDDDFVYEPFFQDFGPVNLAMVSRYCKLLQSKLKDPSLDGKCLVHYCSRDPAKQANAAFLICAYQVIVHKRTAELAYEPFMRKKLSFPPFRDASCAQSTFHLTIADCLQGLEKSIQLGWFDWGYFNVDSYEYFSMVEHGDMNWIIPGKFLAFPGPSDTPFDEWGNPVFTAEEYADLFKTANVGLVVRLNDKRYDRERFIEKGIRHADLYFPDGSCPPPTIVHRFLDLVQSEPNCVAVHCMAGLGRTGTLIGLYAMKQHQCPARAFIAWIRLCRPGSILGPQQQYLVHMQNEMFQAGALQRGPQRSLRAPLGDTKMPASAAEAKDDIVDQVDAAMRRCAVSPNQFDENADVGQGERLLAARRKGNVSHVNERDDDSIAVGPDCTVVVEQIAPIPTSLPAAPLDVPACPRPLRARQYRSVPANVQKPGVSNVIHNVAIVGAMHSGDAGFADAAYKAYPRTSKRVVQ